MDGGRYVRWLDDIGLRDLSSVGPKAARLGEARRHGLPVPDGFCVTVEAYRAAAEGGPRGRRPPVAIPPAVAQAVAVAYQRLCPDGPIPVAVRSSASVEDLADTSFAGQGATWLHVLDLEALQQAILACWASLWSPGARAYRAQSGQRAADLAVAVLVQVQVACEASGVAFSRDPLGQEDVVVVEAAWGMGPGVVGGQGEVDRWWLDRATLAPAREPYIGCKAHQWLPAEDAAGGLRREAVPTHLQRAPCLTAPQTREAAALALRLEALFGGPQDVEFGFQGGNLYLFQSRPVTAEVDPFFSSGPADGERLWTAGFVNERFPQPVSPLGWTLIRPLLEELAFRQPLAYLGVHDLDGREVLRLYRGHPYVDVQVFQHLYKVFPDFLLPEDAARFFPQGEVALRRKVARPRGLWDPALWASLARALVREWPMWSPWHNYRRWMSFEGACSRRLKSLEEELERTTARPSGERLRALWRLVEAGQALNRELLTIHRWSLTLADVLYTLLRRICLRLAGPREGAELAAALVADVETVSVRMNRALEDLAALCREEGGVHALQGTGPAAHALEHFLRRYGHRSYSLDIYVPPFGDDRSQVASLVSGLLEGESSRAGGEGQLVQRPRGRVAVLLRPLSNLARRYVWMREAQRFAWQRVLAFQRRVILQMGQVWAHQGLLPSVERVFFATLDEVREAVVGGASLDTARLERRWRTFQHLCRDDALLPPTEAYPPFLRGSTPVWGAGQEGRALRGVVVSPGLVQGPVRVVRSPADLARVRPGDILVAPALDPGWTPVFGRLAGLVLESGGQLSHGAVVAREYGLPALVGVAEATRLLPEGSLVVLDAHDGQVRQVRGQDVPEHRS